jgi:hypothetical protein
MVMGMDVIVLCFLQALVKLVSAAKHTIPISPRGPGGLNTPFLVFKHHSAASRHVCGWKAQPKRRSLA